MSRAIVCPNPDHDGFKEPVTRYIDAEPPEARRVAEPYGPTRIEAARCSYCAEGWIAVHVRDGYRVTVWAVPPMFEES